jgi:hypothetical protein
MVLVEAGRLTVADRRLPVAAVEDGTKMARHAHRRL